jgi:hypothetical protein
MFSKTTNSRSSPSLQFLLTTAISACSTLSSNEVHLHMMPLDQMPAEVHSAPVTVQTAYQFNAANPDIMKDIPCYCGCGEHRSHIQLRLLRLRGGCQREDRLRQSRPRLFHLCGHHPGCHAHVQRWKKSARGQGIHRRDLFQIRTLNHSIIPCPRASPFSSFWLAGLAVAFAPLPVQPLRLRRGPFELMHDNSPILPPNFASTQAIP